MTCWIATGPCDIRRAPSVNGGCVWRDMAALIAVAAVTGTAGVRPLAAQQHHRVEALYTYDGRPLDFTPDGVWRVKARQVAQQRARLLSQRRFSALNAPIAQAAFNGSALAGTLYVPTILIAFKDTNVPALPDTAQYDSIFYTTTALQSPQRAYTVRKYYEELSHGLFSVQGKVYGWVRADSNQAWYLNACGAGNDPMGCQTGVTRLGLLLKDVLAKVDPTVVFSQYDNNGADNTPNTADDDGVVDLVQFVQPVVGWECRGPGYNAHHFSLSSLTGSPYTTGDPSSATPGNVKVDNYQIVAGVGGLGCTSSTQIMAAGTSAHETGHGLNLPDLYDTGGGTEGVGEWSLMGSGNYTSLNSPAHFDAWSLQQMGWVTLAPLTAVGTYSLGPVERSDSVFVIQPTGSNPRGEYWLLENKQAMGSDSANMETGGSAGPKQGGMLVWHIDQSQITAAEPTNQVNSGPIHGVELVQADGLRQLDISSGGNRGDAGDPYPGTSVNRAYSFSTNPKAVMNNDTTVAAGFALDSIYQRSDSSMVFRFLHNLTVVRATDTTVQVLVRDTTYHRFARMMAQGDTATIDMVSPQFSSDTARQYVFQTWSDAGAQRHRITVPGGTDSVVAGLVTRMRVRATAGPGGTVGSNPAGDLAAGIYVRQDSTIALKATPAAGKVFAGWTGDTTASADSILIHAGKPYTVVATFQDVIKTIVVRATDTTVQVLVRDTAYGRFSRAMTQGDTITIGMVSPQFAADTTREYVFDSWSDGGAQTHTITVQPAIDSVLAALVTRVRVRATAGAGGTVSSNPSGDLVGGIYVRLDSTIALKAVPAAGKTFVGWSGDTTATADSILITATRPYTVVATFQNKLAITAPSAPAPVMGASYSYQLAATGGSGGNSWQVASGALPDGLTLSAPGLISGVPSKTGSFTATVRVTSGAERDSVALQLIVTAPALATADVVSQILGTRTPLSAAQLRYLDLLGNNNGTFDVGDFLAWVDATDAASPAIAAAMEALGATAPAAGGRNGTPKGKRSGGEP